MQRIDLSIHGKYEELIFLQTSTRCRESVKQDNKLIFSFNKSDKKLIAIFCKKKKKQMKHRNKL